MQCRWWWRAVCRHSRAVSPLLTCPAPRDCRLTLRICVACWVSDDLDAWPACARRTVVASVNVIVVTVLDRCPLWPNVLLFLNLHHTTTTPPKTATRPPDITTPPHQLRAPNALPHLIPLLPTDWTRRHRFHRYSLHQSFTALAHTWKNNKSWIHCLGQRRRLLLLRKSHHGAYQPSNQLDHPTATWSPARHGRPLRLVWKPCEIRR